MLPRQPLLVCSFVLLCSACTAADLDLCSADVVARPWEQADELFRRDPSWVGGDGAYSIDLGSGRVLWLFGDSLIDPTDSGSRQPGIVRMISNSIAIQSGYDPANSDISFYWQSGVDAEPAAFFADSPESRYWPGHGVRIHDRLLLFLMRVRSVPDGLGFEVFDWDAVLVFNPDAEPRDWQISTLNRPSNGSQIIVGSGSVFSGGGYVYAYSAKEPGNGPVYVVRWPQAELRQGKLAAMEWWSDDAWLRGQPPGIEPTPVWQPGPTEFTIFTEASGRCFIKVQTEGFGAAVLTLAVSPTLTGPFDDAIRIYDPPENDKAGIMIYQGKAHPHLRGAGLVLTYSSNRDPFFSMLEDDDVYYPRFVRLDGE